MNVFLFKNERKQKRLFFKIKKKRVTNIFPLETKENNVCINEYFSIQEDSSLNLAKF